MTRRPASGIQDRGRYKIIGWLSAIKPDSSHWVHVFGPGCLISLALGLLFTPLAAAATTGVAVDGGAQRGVLARVRGGRRAVDRVGPGRVHRPGHPRPGARS
jgi:hypothetical protein